MLNINVDSAGLAELTTRLEESLKNQGIQPTAEQLAYLVADLLAATSPADLSAKTADSRVYVTGPQYLPPLAQVARRTLETLAWTAFKSFPVENFEFSCPAEGETVPRTPLAVTRDKGDRLTLLAAWRPQNEDDVDPGYLVLRHPDPNQIGDLLAVTLAQGWADHPERLNHLSEMQVILRDKETDLSCLVGPPDSCLYCEAREALEDWPGAEDWAEIPTVETVRECGHVLFFTLENDPHLYLRHRCTDDIHILPRIDGLIEAAGDNAITKGTTVWLVDGLLGLGDPEFEDTPVEGLVTRLFSQDGEPMAQVTGPEGQSLEVALEALIPQGTLSAVPPRKHFH